MESLRESFIWVFAFWEDTVRSKNHKQAFDLFEKASKSDLEAKIYVGFCLENGLGAPKDAKEVIRSYQDGFGTIENVEEKSPAAGFILCHEVYESQLFLQSV